MTQREVWDRDVMPPRIQGLPTDRIGRPIPWFVAPPTGDHDVDFRVASQPRLRAAAQHRLCWTCGHRLEGRATFPVGPMCGVNRVSGEPPSHYGCALYSAQHCPFLSRPHARRREHGLPDGRVAPAGVSILRNPGVTLLWTTDQWTVQRAPGGVLWHFGEPSAVAWLTQGRPATRLEVRASIKSGMPALRRACYADADPVASLAELDVALARLLPLVPPPPPPPSAEGTPT